MDWANVTWVVVGVLLGLYEAYALVNRKPEDTLSEAVWRMSRRPLVPFLAGLLCGHFFWGPQDCLEALWRR